MGSEKPTGDYVGCRMPLNYPNSFCTTDNLPTGHSRLGLPAWRPNTCLLMVTTWMTDSLWSDRKADHNCMGMWHWLWSWPQHFPGLCCDLWDAHIHLDILKVRHKRTRIGTVWIICLELPMLSFFPCQDLNKKTLQLFSTTKKLLKNDIISCQGHLTSVWWVFENKTPLLSLTSGQFF